MFAERSTKYTSFSSRKQPANAGNERKQFTENASEALQQPILTHAHTKCPPVPLDLYQRTDSGFSSHYSVCINPIVLIAGIKRLSMGSTFDEIEVTTIAFAD